MPVLAGWLTGEQVSQEIIEQTLTTMGTVLGRHGGTSARMVQPGMGLITFADNAYALRMHDEPPVLDWIPERRTLVYRRPRAGTHPLYYVENWPAQGNLLFASEIKALLAVGVARHLHIAALDALLRYGFIPAPWTAFKDVSVVPAGANLRWQHTKMHVNPAPNYRLADHASDTLSGITRAELQEQFNTTMQSATHNQLPPHDQLLTLANGEATSALITLLTAQSTTHTFPVTTFGYKKHLRGEQWQAAEHVADHCQQPFLAVTAADQPEFWLATIAGLEMPCVDSRPLAIHQLLHTATTETGARVALSALGASTLLGRNDNRISDTSQTHTTDMLHAYLQKTTTASAQPIAPLWSPDAAHALGTTTTWTDTLYARKLARRADQFATLQQSSYYLDLHLDLPDRWVTPFLQLAQQERVVVRSPFLHKSVLDLLTQLPAIQQDGTTRRQLLDSYLLQLMPDFTNTSTPLPLLAPTSSLLQMDNSDLLKQTLSPEAIAGTGIFAPEIVKQLLEIEHKKKTAARELLFVFTTQLLCLLFGINGC